MICLKPRVTGIKCGSSRAYSSSGSAARIRLAVGGRAAWFVDIGNLLGLRSRVNTADGTRRRFLSPSRCRMLDYQKNRINLRPRAEDALLARVGRLTPTRVNAHSGV